MGMCIRIHTKPTGSAPPDIREQWIGVEIPLMKPPQKPFGFIRGVDGGPADILNMDGFDVTIDDAIAGLRAKGRNDAARWWEMQKQRGIEHLRFGRVFCTQFDNSVL